MSIQALILSLTAVIRPTGLAALFAMLSTGHSRRLLGCYVVAGMSFSVCVGVIVVFALGGNSGPERERIDRPVTQLKEALRCNPSVEEAGKIRELLAKIEQ